MLTPSIRSWIFCLGLCFVLVCLWACGTTAPEAPEGIVIALESPPLATAPNTVASTQSQVASTSITISLANTASEASSLQTYPTPVAAQADATSAAQALDFKAEYVGQQTFQRSLYLTQAMASALGHRLFRDPRLSAQGIDSCASCHHPESTQAPDLHQSAPWPHFVKLAGGVVTLDQMIQICLMRHLQTRPFAWDSSQITALASYLETRAGR